MAYTGIANIIKEYIKNTKSYKENPRRAAIDAFSNEILQSPETSTISTCQNGQVKKYTSKASSKPLFNDLERYLREHTLKVFVNSEKIAWAKKLILRKK